MIPREDLKNIKNYLDNAIFMKTLFYAIFCHLIYEAQILPLINSASEDETKDLIQKSLKGFLSSCCFYMSPANSPKMQLNVNVISLHLIEKLLTENEKLFYKLQFCICYFESLLDQIIYIKNLHKLT